MQRISHRYQNTSIFPILLLTAGCLFLNTHTFLPPNLAVSLLFPSGIAGFQKEQPAFLTAAGYFTINMPCSTPSNPLTKTTQTTETTETTQTRRHDPGGGLCGLFGVTLTPPRQVPPPIKEARIKARDSLDIFRRRKRKNGNNYQDNAICKTPAKEEEEEEEEEGTTATTLCANWSCTMSPVSLLTHLANEFMVAKDASPSPSSMNIQRGRHPFCSRRRMMRSPAGRWVIDVQQEEEYSPSASSMSEPARKKENVDGNQSITDEYLKVFQVFENEQNDEAEEKDTISSNRPFRALPYPIRPKSSFLGPSQGLEPYKVVYDENKVIIPLTGSPEEWEWDRLLEEMENDDNKKR